MQASDDLPWAVVCRGVVGGIEAVIHQTRTPERDRRVEQMVRVRDYDARENRWIVEPIWPAPAGAAADPPPMKSPRRPPAKRRSGRQRRR